jgi:hypothetical protein
MEQELGNTPGENAPEQAGQMPGGSASEEADRAPGDAMPDEVVGPTPPPGSGRSWLTVLFNVLAIAAILMLIPLLAVTLDVRRSTLALEQRLTTAQQSLRQLAAPSLGTAALTVQLETTQKQIQALTVDLATISGRRIAWDRAVSTIWQETGPDVTLAWVQALGRKVTVRGDAGALNTLTAYVDRLRATGYYNSVVIEVASTLGTPVPAPTLPAAPTVTPQGGGAPAPTQVGTQSPPIVTVPPVVIPTATPLYPYPPVYPTPAPTWAPYPPPYPPVYPTPAPTWAPYPPPYPPVYPTPAPTWAPYPPYPPAVPTPTKAPVAAVNLTGVMISPTSIAPGGVIRLDVTVHNIGSVPLQPQALAAPGYMYSEGESAVPGIAGLWRVSLDTTAQAQAHAARYRWGLGATIFPGQSRAITGYLRLYTPGVYTYCAGIVQELVSWPFTCVGGATITVTGGAPSPTKSATPAPTHFPTATFPPFATPTHAPTACPDGYEIDNSWQQARAIGANSSLPQAHSFNALGDQDWVKFGVSPGITYTLRTLGLSGGADTNITLYGNQGGILYEIAQSSYYDPNQGTGRPPMVGASRLSYRFTTTQTATFGTTFYAKVYSPNPNNYGCAKAYQLSLSSGVAQAPNGVRFVSLTRDMPPGAEGTSDVSSPPDAGAALQLDDQRISFTLLLELRGGGP